MRALIAGAGYVGGELARRMVEAGHEVFALRRKPMPATGGVHWISADLAVASSLQGLPDALDAVFYTASADGRSAEAYDAAYVQGPANLLRALGPAAAELRFLFTSSTSVFPQSGGEWVDEDSPATPSSETTAKLLEGEGLVRNAAARGIVLRLAGIYGPGRRRLLDALRREELRLRPEAEFTNRIHRDDCARALLHLAELDAPEALYVGVDDEPVERAAFLGWLADAQGVPTPVVDPAQTPARSNKRCRNRRLRAAGFEFLFPTFREGYAPLIDAAAQGSERI